MLQMNEMKQALRRGVPVFGLISSVPSPLIVEMMGYARCDFVILDMEHVSLNPETLENMVRAAECAGSTPLVRVPDASPAAILRALDCGAQGVVVPHVRDRHEAERVVRASRYHPLGQRGITGGRTTGFGRIPLAEYLNKANDEILVAIMIEDREGVEAIEDILAVPGIDLVVEGAVDLSQSYGVPAQPGHPAVQSAIRRVADHCARQGVPFCAVPREAGEFERWRAQGVNAFLLGDDRAVAFRAFKARVAEFRDALHPLPTP